MFLGRQNRGWRRNECYLDQPDWHPYRNGPVIIYEPPAATPFGNAPPPPETPWTEPIAPAAPTLQGPPHFPQIDSVPESATPVAPRSPIILPDYEEAMTSPLRFQDFPYADGLSGYMAHHKSPNRWSARTTLEFGKDSHGLERTGLGILLEHQAGPGIDFQWNSYREDLGGGFTDELHFSDINFLYRVAEDEHYLVRAGLGVNILGDAYGTDAGINFTSRLDLFPVRPLAVTTEFDMGTIGDTETIHGAARVGLMLDRFELFGGYDYRRIGSIELKGPMAGLQIWF